MVHMSATAKPGVQERILLHLSDYADFINAVEVPFALSQMGIANAVAIARSNVPRAIAGLKDQGLLIERQAHVQGVSRKRKAYFLTDSGMKLADETWKRLAGFSIRCILPTGQVAMTSLGEIKDIIPFQMRPVDVIRYMDDNGVLDIRSLSEDLIERDLSKHVEKQLVTSLTDLPRLRHFYGRETELDNMCNLLEARSTTLLVPGIAGIGKTAMAAKLLERFIHRRNLVYHRCQDWDGSRSFLESMADWLSNIGDSLLSDYILATPVPRPADAAKMLVDGLSSRPSLIVIDDFHKVSDKVLLQLVQAISRELLESEEDIGLVIFSRSFRPIMPLKDAEGQIQCLVLPLDGLDQHSSRNILSSLEDLDEQRLLYIHSLAQGHPLILELINRGASEGTYHETLENYVAVEIFSKLSSEAKRLLSALAVFRESIPTDALAELGLNIDELDELVESGLARQADSDTYDVHDLIREFQLQSLDEQILQELHVKAADWYSRQPSSHEVTIEYIHHSIASGENEEAGRCICEKGRELVAAGHMELLGSIEELDTSELDDSDKSRLEQLCGEVLTLQGRFDDAEVAFSAARALSKDLDDDLLEADILSALADIALKRGDTESAIGMHKEALERFIALKDSRGAARSYNNMGYLLRRRNERAKAMEAYGEVEKILAGDKDDELVQARIILARAFLELGEVERARDHAMSAHSITEGGDDLQHARAQAVLGRYYAKIGDSDLALYHYNAAIEQMGEAGDQLAMVEVTMLLGEVLEDSGRTEEALERYREGLVIAEANDLRVEVGELLARLGGAAPDIQRRMEYLQRALNVFRELGAKSRMREVQMQVHNAVMGR